MRRQTPCETRISAQRRAKGLRRDTGGACGWERVVGGPEARRGVARAAWAAGVGVRRGRAPNAACFRMQRAGTTLCAASPRAAGDAAPCGRGARRRSDAGGRRSRERPGWRPADARAAAEAARWRGAARGADGHALEARPHELRERNALGAARGIGNVTWQPWRFARLHTRCCVMGGWQRGGRRPEHTAAARRNLEIRSELIVATKRSSRRRAPLELRLLPLPPRHEVG